MTFLKRPRKLGRQTLQSSLQFSLLQVLQRILETQYFENIKRLSNKLKSTKILRNSGKLLLESIDLIMLLFKFVLVISEEKK